MLILINNPPNLLHHNDGLATLLVSRTPFTTDEINRLQNAAIAMKFQILFLPNQQFNTTLFATLTGDHSNEFIKNYIVDISAPTDNRPFFFEMLKWKDLLYPQFWNNDLPVPSTLTMLIFLILLGVAIVLTLLFIILPLAIKSCLAVLHDSKALLCYFALIGFGFMMIEISQMQKLSVFLGYPTYGLSIVLTTLLFSSGFGSMLVGKINFFSIKNLNYLYFSILLGVLVLYGFSMPALCYYFTSFNTFVRILVSGGMLLLLGLPLGIAFPCGMRLASQHKNELTPWLWGINGAASVCSSILTVLVSLSLGINIAFWSGVSCYLFAFLSLIYVTLSSKVYGSRRA